MTMASDDDNIIPIKPKCGENERVLDDKLKRLAKWKPAREKGKTQPSSKK